MSRLPDEFHQDRALRDAARDVLMADIDHARHSLSKEGLTNRVTGRIGDGAKDVLEVAKVHADHNRGIIAGFIALLALWFARQPLLEIFGLATGLEEADTAQEPSDASEPEAPEHEFESDSVVKDTDQAEPTTTGETDD